MAYSPAGHGCGGHIDELLHIKLADGRRVELLVDDDTWYVIIDGKYYCAASRHALVHGLETHFHVLKPKIELPEKHPVQIAHETLKAIDSSLIACQAARQDLKSYAAKGDVLAALLLEDLSKKPAPSKAAQDITTRLGKFDFSDITHEELVQHVNNLVLRSSLVHELSQRLRF
jgi:hypothetical protein